MTTSKPLSAKPSKPKGRKCANCKTPFPIFNSMSKVKWCSPECGLILSQVALGKITAVKAKAERADIKARKDMRKTRNEWIAEVQVVFNLFIRTRDIKAGHGCIDCGKPFEPQKPGGSIDAGHYLSRGSAPHLKFEENNCFAQRKNCNRPGGTTREAFREGVKARIGLEALEALESDQTSRDWTIDDLRALKALYQAKIKALK